MAPESQFLASRSRLLAACGRRFWALVVDLSPLGVDFTCLVVKCGTLEVVIRPLQVDFGCLEVNFMPLVVDFGLKKFILGHYDTILATGVEMYFKFSVFWCMAYLF